MVTQRTSTGQARGRDAGFGRWGEQRAVEYLETLGWQIVERNWRCELGEVDIVALEPGGVLVFVEVKARAGTGYGQPLEAITYAKVGKLIDLSRRYLQLHDARPRRVRIDGIGVLRRGAEITVEHARGIGR